jgi:hypothetical protein
MIDEINASKKSFIKETPQYRHDQFISQQQKRFSNRKSDGVHPFSQQPSQTFFEDPLVVGSIGHYSNFLDYNNRAVSSSTKQYGHRGGALMLQQPYGGALESDSESDSGSDAISSSDEEEGGCYGGDLHSKSKAELIEIAKGAGIYDDYIKPAGQALGHVGKEIFNEVVVPIGKELVKDAITKKIRGGKRGRPKGSKSKKQIEGAGIYSDYIKPAGQALVNTGKAVFNDVVVPVGKELVKDAVKGAIMGAVVGAGEKKKRGRPKGSKNKGKGVPEVELKNLEDEKDRVDKEITFEKGMEKAEGADVADGGKEKTKCVLIKPARKGSQKLKDRAEMVKKIMKEKGLTLPQASRYIKEHNISYPSQKETWV